MSSTPQDVLKDVFEIYHRLFDHNPAIRGEINFFFNNFKDGDDIVSPASSGELIKPAASRLETLLHASQVASEAGDIDWQKTIRQSEIDKVTVKLDAAATMMEKLVERGRSRDGAGPYGEYMEKSKQDQWQNLQQFSTDIQKKRDQVDEEITEKIEDLRRHFENLARNRTP